MKVSKSVKPEHLPLVAEVKFQMFINGIYYSDFLCTPDSITELVTGNLYVNSNITAIEDIEKICINGYKIDVIVADTEGRTERAKTSGEFSPPGLEKLIEFAKLMFDRAAIYKEYGGIHCSALSDGINLIAFNEDIGRHNAFDKVVGTALMKDFELDKLIYITSGRVNLEVMNKAVACGIPLIVSRSIMSSAAFDQAEKNGTMVIGRILTAEPFVYEGK
ncbi:MAG: formate dehydrogenase accessory sulfurtransferase FdhD [Spirochaetales bacterium]|nr:formate dehydrogenase accessory sulfurtransferase FdhD [Spirochaetales bacterium]